MDELRCSNEEEAQRFLSLVEEHLQRQKQQPTSPIYPIRPTQSVLGAFTRFREHLEEQQRIIDQSKKRIREAQESAAAKQREEEATERKEQEKREREAKQRAELARQKEELRKLERRHEWSDAWKRYENGWKSADDTDNLGGNKIPWPTKSGLRQDLSESSVRQFFQKTAFVYSSNDHAEELFQTMTKETKRWHSDKIQHRFRRDIFQSKYREDIDMVTKLIVVLWKEAKMGRGGNK
ncbi:uncharacterized protein NECHADRAFT_86508 [Fusarium vanettenii 77-13-4]|uniref:Uncharacterized protein n=1 Tax=Fusarium vanettenii (strain ATCC MYA-4622 / CBS 123669 / FGSC 9596 / NRRL 45880 / 77-13-4) TaxID=660122 RepID=C7ZH71_FUSV7|nr:uncharacterized protein NECHADRAFT_86508 [Fusarium vanettenii 77-13-4]EEU36701.1 hypothetical protein NECHADRAFT_86508 [Fusarium vanettenii 77-13-4]